MSPNPPSQVNPGHIRPQSPTASLSLTTGELKKFLAEDNPPFAPPDGDTKQKELNLLMATIVMVRLFDQSKRRTRQSLWDAMEDVREVIIKFGEGAGDHPVLVEKTMTACKELAKESEKLCPVPRETIKLVLLALADLGHIRPYRMELSNAERKEFYENCAKMNFTIAKEDQNDETASRLFAEHFKNSILNSRAVLFSTASQLGKRLEQAGKVTTPKEPVTQQPAPQEQAGTTPQSQAQSPEQAATESPSSQPPGGTTEASSHSS